MNAVYIFYRGDVFYPLELPDADEQIATHVKLNPGTTKVTKLAGAGTEMQVWPSVGLN